jgi:hypothetical protein
MLKGPFYEIRNEYCGTNQDRRVIRKVPGSLTIVFAIRDGCGE